MPPLTPKFTLDQTDQEVLVKIFVPAASNLASFSHEGGQGVEIYLSNEDDDNNETPNDEDNNNNNNDDGAGGGDTTAAASTLHFFASPCYLLNINFAPYRFQIPHDGGPAPPACYNPQDHTITIRLTKVLAELWPDFDTVLTSKWLMQSAMQQQTERTIPKQWLHAVVNNDDDEDDDDDDDDHEGDDEEENNKVGEDTEPNYPSIGLESNGGGRPLYGYGFADMFQRVLTDYCRAGLAQEMLELGKVTDDVERVSPVDRREWRIQKEQDDFDVDRYLGDYYLERDDLYMYDMVLDFVPWWKLESGSRNRHKIVTDLEIAQKLQSKLTIHDKPTTTTGGLFTEDERVLLTTIPYPLLPTSIASMKPSSRENMSLWCGLVDILLAYTYDHLTTMGDPTVESAWTVSVLSPRLSWLDNGCEGEEDAAETSGDDMVRSTIQTFLRRALIYPYWRNFKYCMDQVVRNLHDLLQSQGVPGIVKCLLQVRTMMTKTECYYLNNKIWIDPYLYWVQQQQPEDPLEQILRILRQLIDQESDGDTTCTSTSFKQTLGLDLCRHEAMLWEDGEGEESDSADNGTDGGVSSSDDDGSDEDSTSSDEEVETKKKNRVDIVTDASNNGAEASKVAQQRSNVLLDDIVGVRAVSTGEGDQWKTNQRAPLIQELT